MPRGKVYQPIDVDGGWRFYTTGSQGPLIDRAPAGRSRAHAIKHDGFRVIAFEAGL
jgi:hypothetical protein